MASFPSFLLATALALAPGPPSATAREAHFVTRLAEGKRQKIVVYGTSLTANSAWPADLCETLRRAHGRRAQVVNAGRGGADSRWGLAKLHPRVIRQKPDTVFIEFTINDALAESQLSVHESMWNLEQMIAMIRRDLPWCDINVMIMNPPTGDALRQRPRIRDYEKGWRQVAARNSCRLIDFSGIWRGMQQRQPARWQSLVPDGLHPTDRAAREVILPHLLQKVGFPASAAGP